MHIYIYIVFRIDKNELLSVGKGYKQRHGLLTTKAFFKALKKPGDILHLSGHGYYDSTYDDYKFQFDEQPLLQKLLDPNNMFSSYYAAIFLLFEEGLILLNTDEYYNVTSIQIRKDKDPETQLTLFENEILRKALISMIQYRFGCKCQVKYGSIEIKKIYRKDPKTQCMIYTMNTTTHKFRLKTIYQNDNNVKAIVRNILELYEYKAPWHDDDDPYDFNELIKCIVSRINEYILSKFLDDKFVLSKRYEPLYKPCQIDFNDIYKLTYQGKIPVPNNHGFTDHELGVYLGTMINEFCTKIQTDENISISNLLRPLINTVIVTFSNVVSANIASGIAKDLTREHQPMFEIIFVKIGNSDHIDRSTTEITGFIPVTSYTHLYVRKIKAAIDQLLGILQYIF